jgi:hypothetical protein
MGTASSQHTCGYRVLDVQPNSPGLRAGLVSFFDFIMKAEEQTFEVEGDELVKVLTRHKGRKLALVVYNTKSGTFREVSIVPSDTWGGDGLLGITIRHDSYDAADSSIRVLDVVPGSPAADAGLIANSDYILGTAAHTFTDASELFEIVLDQLNKTLDIYVYNSETDRVSLTRLKPNNDWGGEGCLGLDVGQGYLHALPTESRKTNGVACSLVTTQRFRAFGSEKIIVDPLAAVSTRPQHETKVSRARQRMANAEIAHKTITKAETNEARLQDDNVTDVTSDKDINSIRSATGLSDSQPASPQPSSLRVPARLPLSATLSPREGKQRIAGTKTPM